MMLRFILLPVRWPGIVIISSTSIADGWLNYLHCSLVAVDSSQTALDVYRTTSASAGSRQAYIHTSNDLPQIMCQQEASATLYKQATSQKYKTTSANDAKKSSGSR
jgi:hypothetical protein